MIKVSRMLLSGVEVPRLVPGPLTLEKLKEWRDYGIANGVREDCELCGGPNVGMTPLGFYPICQECNLKLLEENRAKLRAHQEATHD